MSSLLLLFLSRLVMGLFWPLSRPFIAFSRGVIVNVVLGFLLSAVVFGSYWAALGTP